MSLYTDLSMDVWLKPTSGDGAGYNAVTSNADFTLTGTADGYTTGDAGQEVLQMSASDSLGANSGFGAGTYLKELDENSQFWVMVYWNPQGDTGTWQVAWQTTNAASAGVRMRMHADGSTGQFYIHDGTANVTMTPPIGDYGDWDNEAGNVILFQVNIPSDYIEVWVNNRTSRTLSFHRKSIAGLTWTATPEPNTIDAQCDLNGDVMLASGTGILTESQIERLMQYGRGVSWAEINNANGAPESLTSWRADPQDTSLKIDGCFSEAVNLRLYADSSRTAKGSLLSSSGSLTPDSQGWVSHTFTGLTADTTYQVFAEYSSGYQDRRRMRLKTLPASRDGLLLGFGGCWEWDPDIAFDNVLSVESMERLTSYSIFQSGIDVFCSSGDDGYYDYIWNNNLSELGLPTSAAEFQQCHEYVFGELKVSNFFERVPFYAGAFSDHDSYGNDLFGDEITNLAGCQAHLAQRYGRTYPLAPDSLYYSWESPGITWIALDLRTESDQGVQLTSTAQRAQMQSDMESAIARGDLIIMFCEIPWDDGESPSPAHSWENYSSERTDIFDRIVAAGADKSIITIHGDHHAGGVDIDGVSQSGFDTDNEMAHPSILASRYNSINSGQAGAAAVWPDYYDNGNGHWFKLLIEGSGQGADLTVTPYEGATAKTAITRTIEGAPAGGAAPFYLGIYRRKLDRAPTKRIYPKTKRGSFK